jgi:hypothetical protein
LPAIGAKVESTDAVKNFRAALIKFAEMGNTALTSADSDVDRVLGWLERDQTVFWASQVRKRHAEVIRCEEAIREKRMTKNFDGTAKSVVDEMKALQNAKRRKEEAEQKVVAVNKAIHLLRKEAQMYKGRVQKLATTLQGDIPRAVHMIDNMLAHLDQYLSIQTTGAGYAMGAAAESMAKAAASVRVGVEKLRDRTPNEEARRSATLHPVTPDDPLLQPWAVGAMEAWQKSALESLTIERTPVDPDQKIIIARNCWTRSKVYLERMSPLSETDSGWFIGAADDEAEKEKFEYDSYRAGDVIAARPDLADLLSLPVGFLAMLDSGGPVAMLDGAGLDVWAVALIAGGPPEETPGEQAASTESPAESSTTA